MKTLSRTRAIAEQFFEALNTFERSAVSEERRKIVEEEAAITAKWIVENEANVSSMKGKNPFDCMAQERLYFDAIRGLTYDPTSNDLPFCLHEKWARIAVLRHFRQQGIELSERQIDAALRKVFDSIFRWGSPTLVFRLKHIEEVRKRLMENDP